MSQLTLKQLRGPSGSAPGALVVYDGTKPVWSSALTSGIALPMGTTAERPLAPSKGFVRFNTTANEVEAWDGNVWVSLQTSSFLSLKDTPSTYVAGQYLRVNADATGLEFYTPEPPTSSIKSADSSTFFDANRTGYEGKAVAGTDSRVVFEVEGKDTVVTGERLAVSNDTNEVQLLAKNTTGTGNVDLRILPQEQGHVFFGTIGDGVVEAERTFDLYVKGGDALTGETTGNVYVVGGTSTVEDETVNIDGGDVIIKQSRGIGTGIHGGTRVEDRWDTTIVDFKSVGDISGNWLEIRNGGNTEDAALAGIKLGVANESVSATVNIYLDPKNDGLVRVSDYGTYQTALLATGGNDALVTKGYVLSLAGLGEGEENSTIAGTGLTDDSGVFNVNVNANTVGVDGSNNLVVKSNSTAGLLLTSTGIDGQEAIWAPLNLSNTASFSGVLAPANGGVGYTSFLEGDVLVGNASGSLDRLALGTAGQVLVSNGTTLAYSLITELYDTNSAYTLRSVSAVDAVNHLTVKNSAIEAPVEIGSDGTDENVDIRVAPKGTGLLVAKTGYTAAIGDNPETFVTKQYVDNAQQASTERYMREATISADFASSMNIGEILPSVLNRDVYVSRATIRVIAPIVGGGATQARIMSGTDVVMEFMENDILATGNYIADLIESFTSTNTQLVLQFFQNDGTTLATPTGGSLEVKVHYKIR